MARLYKGGKGCSTTLHPGARLSHATRIFNQWTPIKNVTSYTMAFGYNNLLNNTTDDEIDDYIAAVQGLHARTKKAKIVVVEISTKTDLLQEMHSRADYINDRIRSALPSAWLAPVDPEEVLTESHGINDGPERQIHFDDHTAARVFDGICRHLTKNRWLVLPGAT